MWKAGGTRTANGRESCNWRRGRRRIGIRFVVSPGERATVTEAVRPGVVNPGLCGTFGSCIGPGSGSDPGAYGRTTKGC